MKALAVIAATVWMLAACAAAPPKAAPPPPAAAPAPLDASYDWHVLLTAPLGTGFKQTPFTLHEVLLFSDDTKSRAADAGECYAIDGTAPRFISRVPDDYLLCFKHDRLAHVEALVRVPQDMAAQIFADACHLWFKNAGLPAPVIAAATESSPAACSGQDGSTKFGAQLEIEAAADAPLSIKLDAVEQP